MIPYKQLSLADIFEDCQNIFEEGKPQFLSLLEQHIGLSEYIPLTFYNHFYASTERTCTYPLAAFIRALVIQKIFSIPTDRLMPVFLQYSKPLRDFCGFKKIPDASKTTRFKQNFLSDLQSVFDNLVDVTEPICQEIDAARTIRQLKAYIKTLDKSSSSDPYKAACKNMPSHASYSLSDSPALISCGFQIHIFKNSPTFFSKTLDKPLQKYGALRLLVKKALFIPAQPVSIFDWRRFLCYLLIMAVIPPIRIPSYLNF